MMYWNIMYSPNYNILVANTLFENVLMYMYLVLHLKVKYFIFYSYLSQYEEP